VLDQADFLNAVVAIETSLDPEGLLRLAKGVEAELGRDFGQIRHGPRVVDVDLLLLGDIELRTERLTIPHPEVTTRRFVLVPLLEIAPDLPYREALDRLEGQRVERVGVL
jgi:2-amino-4-hydroxy-6-hydroxymethyldihydropteridine diphosphokinase